MLKKHSSGIPPKIEMYIRIQIARLHKTNLFQIQERDDLFQDLALFYLEHFYKKDVDIPDELLFIALRRQANHLIRSRLRSIRSGVFFNESLNSMFEENGIEIRSDFCLEDLENKIDINIKLESLSQKEKSIINLLLKGCSIEKITKTLHLSNSTVYKVLSKIKDL
ncbi:MAG: hypothetical protein IKC10_03180 [Alphaproteobacteria bacterium]|nr:hypothetical protein [Alphaproteobacteria bacterium]